jgi:hypothetical protein
MGHFPGREWWNFALAAVPPEQSELMQIHLDGGCEQCQKLLATWLSIPEFFRREASFQPPESAVRMAKLMFSPARSRWLPLIAEFAHLLFDSARQSPLAHVRGSIQINRRLLHETESFTIDLKVEAEPGAKRIHLIGQILNSKEPGVAIENAPVTLLNAKSFATEGRTNLHGEFDLELIAPGDWQLFIEPPDCSPIGIRLTS